MQMSTSESARQNRDNTDWDQEKNVIIVQIHSYIK